MSTGDPAYEAATVLSALSLSPSGIGYRMQAMLAEVLLELNFVVEDVARAGHPDITGRVEGARVRIQVKATRSSTIVIEPIDIDGIQPASDGEEGYFAVLNLRPPVEWVFVPYGKVRPLQTRRISFAMLRAASNRQLSDDCSRAFVAYVLRHRDSIQAHAFGLVRKRALEG